MSSKKEKDEGSSGNDRGGNEKGIIKEGLLYKRVIMSPTNKLVFEVRLIVFLPPDTSIVSLLTSLMS